MIDWKEKKIYLKIIISDLSIMMDLIMFQLVNY